MSRFGDKVSLGADGEAVWKGGTLEGMRDSVAAASEESGAESWTARRRQILFPE